MPTLTQITQSIMQDPDNQSFTAKRIEPLFAAPTTARINIVGQALELKRKKVVYIGMIKAVIAYANG